MNIVSKWLIKTMLVKGFFSMTARIDVFLSVDRELINVRRDALGISPPPIYVGWLAATGLEFLKL